MLTYILKRLGSTIIVLFGASVLVFFMVVHSGDPLSDLRESNDPDAAHQMEQRTQAMNLDQPWYIRYWWWFRGVAGCVTLSCDFGTNRDGQHLNSILANAAQDSLRLVFIATIASIVLGILIGIISAIRQYSLFDYTVSFIVFVFFSLPIFWAAVLGKEWLAIRYNNWMADGSYSWGQMLGISVVLAIALPLIIGGEPLRRVITAGMTFVASVGALWYFDASNFAHEPRLGAVGIIVLSLGLAVGLTALLAGLGNRRVLYTALTVSGLGIVSYYATWELLAEPAGGWFLLLGLFLLTIAICLVLARTMGGYAKGQATAVAVITGMLTSGLILLDHFMYHWPSLLSLKSRPVSTIGSHTRRFTEDDVTFWQVSLDQLTQLWIPTMLLMIVSLATYTRYTRASMLEVARQDYIRTARAKGANERTVVFKHAFRNALIPLATIVAFDFAGLIGGTVIVESIFNWNGMGGVFITGLRNVDPAPVMGFVMITGFVAVIFNFIADIMYAVLDPRIRV
ncbi:MULTISPECIES: ABC transporter permease [Actinomycetes]|uniref:ABC transmembrane type-1 domain-containing protein n=2 Tax=Actinomycetes TaxID=1760 RepID=A0ABP6M194_9MICC|nr:ABC transporter permease [Nesterenkonia sp. CL21]MDS2171243.1 ABC transporter permease [Nesterenkonia sp. CL21]